MPVVDAPGLRPTPSRTRDRLFNWLAPHLPDAHVLDLFAGSGVLGLEACSRGAKSCTFVEQNRQVATQLKQFCAELHLTQATVRQADAKQWLAQPASTPLFDVVFVDPPFALDVLPWVMEALPKHLSAQAWVYVEAGSKQALPHELETTCWLPHRDGKSAETRYVLYRWTKVSLQ